MSVEQCEDVLLKLSKHLHSSGLRLSEGRGSGPVPPSRVGAFVRKLQVQPWIFLVKRLVYFLPGWRDQRVKTPRPISSFRK